MMEEDFFRLTSVEKHCLEHIASSGGSVAKPTEVRAYRKLVWIGWAREVPLTGKKHVGRHGFEITPAGMLAFVKVMPGRVTEQHRQRMENIPCEMERLD